jgi:DNA-binding SARP family transcriptional activator
MDERDFWDLKLLGDMGLRIGGRVLPKFPTKKVALLVAVVALEHPKPVSRDRLTSILWPDATQAQGRQNLRKALSMLRQTLGGDSAAVATDGDCVGLRAHITTDVQRLEQSISVSATPRGRADTLLLALTQYEPFLEGMYEDWVIEQRQRVQRLFVAASTEATSLFLEQKRPAEAVDAARRAAEVDDLSEVAHLSLIRALVADNRIAEAAAQAEALRRRFYDEFGEDMSAETRTAIRALLADARQRPELLMDKVKQEPDPERIRLAITGPKFRGGSRLRANDTQLR